MKQNLFTLLALCFVSFNSFSQKDTLNEKYTPYELMSQYYADDFNPFKKRNVYVGLSFSLSDNKLENVNQLVQTVLDGKRNGYSILLSSGYFTGDFGMVGASFEFHESRFNGLVLRSQDTLSSKSITRGFVVTPKFRSMIPLTENQRLSFFTELGVSFGYLTGISRDTKNLDEITKSSQEQFDFGIGLSPGINFFAMENFALEVQLDILGYTLSVQETTQNGEETSRYVSNNIDFNIDILTLQLGLSYYIDRNKSKK